MFSFAGITACDNDIKAIYSIQNGTAYNSSKYGGFYIIYNSEVSEQHFTLSYGNGTVIDDSLVGTPTLQTSGKFAGYYTLYYTRQCGWSYESFESDAVVVANSSSDIITQIENFFFDGELGLVDSSNGNDSELSDSWRNSEQSTAFGSWFSDVFSGLSNIVNAITQAIQSILNGIGQLFTDLKNFLSDLIQSLIDGIVRIFIPEDDVISGFIDEIVNCFKVKFGFEGFDISQAIGQSQSIQNINGTIKYGQFEFNGIIVDFSFFVQALTTFRPYIRALLAFFIVLYNINQFLGLIGIQGLALGAFLNMSTQKNSNNQG